MSKDKVLEKRVRITALTQRTRMRESKFLGYIMRTTGLENMTHTIDIEGRSDTGK